MYIVKNVSFKNVSDAIKSALETWGNSVYYNGKEISDDIIDLECNCLQLCPNTCIHKEYKSKRTVCYYQWTCDCECNCPMYIFDKNHGSCLLCDTDVCGGCFVKLNGTIFGLCGVCNKKTKTPFEIECINEKMNINIK